MATHRVRWTSTQRANGWPLQSKKLRLLYFYFSSSIVFLYSSKSYGHQGTSNVVLFPFNSSKYPDEKNARITSIEGRGPHPDRQDHSHCHQVFFHRHFLYVVDLGTDTISVYRFDEINGELSLMGSRIKLQLGAGPRHILFHRTKPLAFVCNELNSTVNVYRVQTSCGQFEFLQTIETRRQTDDKNQENYPAEIQFSPDESQILVSNRGDENLVVFDIRDETNEILHVQQHVDCYGSFPRYFGFDPTGHFLLIANQKTNNLVCFSYDRQRHVFKFISELKNIESPQHFVFLS